MSSSETEVLRQRIVELETQVKRMRPKWYTTCGACGNTFVVYSEAEGRARNPRCYTCRGLPTPEEPVLNAA